LRQRVYAAPAPGPDWEKVRHAGQLSGCRIWGLNAPSLLGSAEIATLARHDVKSVRNPL
jgi:hypothetical protein